MRHAEIAIVGGGLAGSTAAVMLGRAGHNALSSTRMRFTLMIFAARSSMRRRSLCCA